jgi:CBS domain-containing protein
MKISQLLGQKTHFVATIAPEATVRDLVAALAEHNVGALVVSVDGATVKGIVSERDVVRAMSRIAADEDGDMDSVSVAEIMTTNVVTCGPDATVHELMVTMTESRVRHVPVVGEENTLDGIVSIGDLVKHRIAELEDERQALIDYVTG